MSDQGYLSTLSISPPAFTKVSAAPPLLQVLWAHLAAGETRAAQLASRELLRRKTLTDRETLAALLNAAAATELQTGNPEECHRLAKRSAGVFPDQWMAHGLRIAAFATAPGSRAFRYIASVQLPDGAAGWDEVPSPVEHKVTAAALAWRSGLWDDVARSLDAAYPAGVATMPSELKSDVFRLAFYRNQPQLATAAARSMLTSSPVDQLDMLLNAMVQNGWTAEALPLYREAFERNETSQLLRRRLVGLCIKQGELDEARKLASSGALNIVV
jgi:hypothetical protein